MTRAPARPTLARPGVLVMDMDSTLIRCECIDEIADLLGLKPEVAAITARAMAGELDFAASLRARVKLLAGLPLERLEEVWRERVRLTPGAERLVETLHAHDWAVGVVSGGFTFFTDRLQRLLGLDFAHANELEVEDGRLTGRVLGRILDGRGKREALLREAEKRGVPRAQTVAVGDGANDAPMLEAAGLGIAFHAKPALLPHADAVIAQGGLDEVLRHLEGAP